MVGFIQISCSATDSKAISISRPRSALARRGFCCDRRDVIALLGGAAIAPIFARAANETAAASWSCSIFSCGTDQVLLSDNLSHGLFWARRLCNLRHSKNENFRRSFVHNCRRHGRTCRGEQGMNCNYIRTQLKRIQEAKVGAAVRLSSAGSTRNSRSSSGPWSPPYRGSETRCGGKGGRPVCVSDTM